ncbi:hypothetical protein PIB30_072582 [Stylosanthes scabra]|uniref:Uncharacterized protein n=1 Tax=Stylosanthes scabra TaxID=79078 RepID=A0ABU6UNG0_9FABA|nr:hypothetical protein [Stylosanthes scabra]
MEYGLIPPTRPLDRVWLRGLSHIHNLFGFRYDDLFPVLTNTRESQSKLVCGAWNASSSLPAWRDIESSWVTKEGEIETWRATVPIVLFMNVRFHHVDRMKRQFGSEQPIPLDPVNLDGFFGASARGEDKWWPNELHYWYNFWNNRRARD